MRTLRDIQVGVRAPAVIALAMVALWCLSVWLGERAGKGFVSNLGLFWVFVFSLAPLIAPLFAGLALFLHFRLGRTHGPWAYLAMLAAVAPWLWFLIN
jgi:hypothetical protein